MFLGNLLSAFLDLGDDTTLQGGRKSLSDEIINELIFNSLKGKKYFRAVCLSNPVQIQPDKISIGTKLYNPVKVRPLDIHGFVLPDPCNSNLSPAQIASVVQAHPIAFGVRPLDSGERIPHFGDILKCYFSIDGPNNGGRLRGIRYEYALKTHTFDYACSDKYLKASKKFSSTPLILAQFSEPPEVPPPPPKRRARPVQPAPEMELPEEEESSFAFPSGTHSQAKKDFGDWFKWNIISGNYPLFKVRGSSGPQAVFPNPIAAEECCVKVPTSSRKASIDKGHIRYYNTDYPILLPQSSTDKFPSFKRADPYADIESEYIRTIILRILPFNMSYNWPYNDYEFKQHLNRYPELAAHWISVKGVHQCTRCVNTAESFWNARSDKAELLRRASTPDYAGGSGIRDEDWPKYLTESDWIKPEPSKYTAVSGDSVYKISRKYSIDKNDFIRWNSIVGNFIGIGKEYIIEDPNNSKFQPPALRAQLVVFGDHDFRRVPCSESKIEWEWDTNVWVIKGED